MMQNTIQRNKEYIGYALSAYPIFMPFLYKTYIQNIDEVHTMGNTVKNNISGQIIGDWSILDYLGKGYYNCRCNICGFEKKR